MIKISNVDAAKCQLQKEITLWFKDEDPVLIHTLVFAAYEVSHSVSKSAIQTAVICYSTRFGSKTSVEAPVEKFVQRFGGKSFDPKQRGKGKQLGAAEKRSPVIPRHRRQGGGGSFYFFSILRPLGPTSMRMPSGCLRS
jgi:hypothetical protein